MSSPSVAPPVLGAQRPRICAVPAYDWSHGEDAVELCALAGLHLDQWQQFALTVMLGVRTDGLWAAFEAALEVARQNGKGGVLEGRELTGLFLLGERLIIHTAHEFATALKAFERMQEIIAGTPEFLRRLKPRGGVTRSHGFEGIHLKGGQHLEYRTRTKGGGRGFSGDCVIFDESMHIPEAMQSALLPVLASRPNPQIVYAGSAVDQQTMEHGLVAARLRARALAGTDPRLAYLGWGADIERPDLVTPEQAADPRLWAASNPAYGIRITREYVEAEQRSLGTRGFAVERLGVGDWPDPMQESDRKITDAQWAACRDPRSAAVDPVCLAFAVSEDRKHAAIAAAGRRPDGDLHIETVDRGPGTSWLAPRLAELKRRHRPTAIVVATGSPAASLATELDELRVRTTPASVQEQAKACAMLYDAIERAVQRAAAPRADGLAGGALRHLGSDELLQAVRGGAAHRVGDAWVWSLRASTVDVTPLVACTLALWGLLTRKPRRARVVDLNEALRAAETRERQEES